MINKQIQDDWSAAQQDINCSALCFRIRIAYQESLSQACFEAHQTMNPLKLIYLGGRCVRSIILRAWFCIEECLVQRQVPARYPRQEGWQSLRYRSEPTFSSSLDRIFLFSSGLINLLRKFANSFGSRWMPLLIFTQPSHRRILAAASLFEVLSGGAFPLFTIILGQTFNAYAQLGVGAIDHDEFASKVISSSTYLAMYAAVTWLLHAMACVSGHIFAELQTESVRLRTFDALLRRDQTWFDTCGHGIRATVHKIQR